MDSRAGTAMMPEPLFLRAICNNPEDDTPRLIYADWLEEHGQPERAEFMRVQCELARMVVFNDRRRQLQLRQQLLLERRGREWLMQEWPRAANRSVNCWTFERGFVAELSLQGRGLRESGARALAMNPRLALLTALDLRKNGITSVALQALAASPLLARLVVLDLRENPSPTESLGALAQSPYLGQLRELLVGPKGIRFDEVERWFRWCGEKVAVHSGEDYPGR